MSEIQIPFSGFYESLWSDGIDREEEQLIEHLRERDEDPVPDEVTDADLQMLIMDCCDYGKAYREVARHYVDIFNDWLTEKLGEPINLAFKAMESPREYNFTTDRLFSNISEKDILTLFDRVDSDLLTQVCEGHFRSRSGFISFYDYNWRNWGDPLEWDHNQLSMLLYALIEEEDYPGDLNLTLYHRMDDGFYHAFEEGMDWPKFEQKLAEAILIAQGEVEEDGREFPPPVLNTQTYVEAFDKLNNLKGAE